jgi:hypothetical protein
MTRKDIARLYVSRVGLKEEELMLGRSDIGKTLSIGNRDDDALGCAVRHRSCEGLGGIPL